MKKTLLTAAVALATLTTVKSQITAGLEAQYLLDGTITDTHNSNDLTASGSIVYESNRLNQPNTSFRFGGSTELNCPVDLSAMSSKSISLWFITDQPGGLIGHDGSGGNAPILYIGSDNKLKGKFFDGSQGSVSTSNKILTDSIWHHVVITAGPTGQTVYLDNQLVGTRTNTVTSLVLDNTTIGNVIASGWPSAPSNTNFVGSIDDIRIYNSVIGANIVDSLYNTPVWNSPYNLDTLYVNQNATGANNGSSWTDAYTDARDAFINTTPNAEIWIAQGTYIRNSTDRNTVFGWSQDSIRVYGGFTGSETMRNQRDWNANPTIFSGDIGVTGDSTDNAYTVFIGPVGDLKYALIDGVKITGGNADQNSYPNNNSTGGGMIVDNEVDHIIIKNVEFYGNYAKEGGAISTYGSSGDDCNISLENVIAHHNTGSSSAFGHFRASAVAPIILEMTNCLIYENYASGTNSDKGTVLFLGGNANAANTLDATITNCTFANNSYMVSHSSQGMIRLFNQTTAPSILKFTNNICFGNNITEITDQNGLNATNPFNTVNLFHNILENGIDFTATNEVKTFTTDPLFNNDYTLQVGSPAIDSGSISFGLVPTNDLAGNNRIFGAEIDLGAYEYISSTTSLNEVQKNSVIAYPNPTSNNITIEGVEEKIERVNITNISGQEILNLNSINNIDVSKLSPGTYIIHVKTKFSKYTSRFIKN